MNWHTRGFLLLALFTLQLPFLSDAQAASVMYLADGNTDTLNTVDIATGSATVVGGFGVDAVNVGLTYDANNDQLLMTSRFAANNSGLYSVNQSNGAISLIGETGISAITGLAYDNASQTLYAGSGFEDALYRLNTSTASAALIGSFNIAPPANITGHGLAFDPVSSKAYLTDFATDNLYEVNTANGSLSLAGSTSLDGAVGMAFDPEANMLYGIDVDLDQLVSFDLGTGEASAIGPLGFDSFNVGLAVKATAVPEPLTTIALASAFAAYGFRRRKGVSCRNGSLSYLD